MRLVRRSLLIGVAWCGLWLTAALIVGTIIGIVDPDSIDPGDSEGLAMVAGLMGFLAGAVFATLAGLAHPGTPPSALSLAGVAAWGLVANVIVQAAFLGHGDAGLVANIQMGLVFCAVGALIALAWSALARRWPSHPIS